MKEIKTNNVEHNKVEGFKDIKPKGDVEVPKNFTKDLFSKGLEKLDMAKELINYKMEIMKFSEFKDTLNLDKLNLKDIKKPSPEQNKVARAEFNKLKNILIRGWEKNTGKEWPRYKEDVYDHGKLIRKKGDRYDVHHIKPLNWGGKNEVSNITPIAALNHYDHKGIHRPDGPCSKISKELGGK